jgi:hypothetical protein
MFKLIAIEDVQHAGEGRVVCLHSSEDGSRCTRAARSCGSLRAALTYLPRVRGRQLRRPTGDKMTDVPFKSRRPSKEALRLRISGLYIPNGSGNRHDEEYGAGMKLAISRAALVLKQERPVDLLNVDPAILYRLDRIGDFSSRRAAFSGSA